MKRFCAAIFGMSIIAALLSAGPATAADSTVTGTVSNGTTTVTSGMVAYYATCEDFDQYNPAGTDSFSAGSYSVTVPDGTYRVYIYPDPGYGAVAAWHNGKESCDDADLVNVSGNGTANLVTRAGFNVSGTITSTNGAVGTADITFYASCRAYRNRKPAASSYFDTTYTLTVPAGTYYALISPNPGTGAIDSWHDAKTNCTDAQAITVNGNVAGKTLHALPGVQLAGSVTSARGAINNASIQFYSTCEDYQDNNESGMTYATSGHYNIMLPADTYFVRIGVFNTPDGALTSWHNAATSCADATAITVSGVNDVEHLIARSAVAVTGTVIRAGGGPLTGGTVAFFENCRAYDGGRSAGGGNINSSGQYTANVPTGTYLVHIYPEGDNGVLPSWHNGTRDCDKATAVSVPGSVARDLVAATGYVVTGSVGSSAGTVQDGNVTFFADCDASVVGSASIESGTYTASLPAGTYRVYIEPEDEQAAVASWHNAKATCENSDLVTVGGNRTLDLVARGAGRVTGAVSSANGTVESGTISFFATCDDYVAREPAAQTWFSSSQYALSVPNGTYRVRVYPDSDEAAIDSWHHATSACEQATVVTVNGNTNVNVVAETGTHLTGAVTSSSGAVTSGTALFFDSCQSYQDWNAIGYAQIRKGQYSAWLAPGTYLARIQPAVDNAAQSWHNAKNSCASADVVTVSGSSTSQTLVASPGVDVTGLVTKGGKPIAYGNVAFYATCQDFLAGQPSGSASIDDGLYTLTVAPGSYRVRITVGGRDGEKYSWHASTGTCGSATPVSVSGSTTANLQARTTLTISGTVSGPGGPLDWGWVEFYATCQDYLEGNLTAFAQMEQGTYTIGLPNGSFLARVHPYTGAATSWHNAAENCGSATAIPVIAAGAHNLVAARGAVVTGSISSSAGPVSYAGVEFFNTCRDYSLHEQAGSARTTKGVFSLNIVPGTYRVLIYPAKGTGARQSWHAAKVSCETADLVTITGDGQLALVALPKTAHPHHLRPLPARRRSCPARPSRNRRRG